MGYLSVWALVLVVLAQVPCAPGDLTVVCHCKQGMASACEVLRQSEPKLAEALESVLVVARAGEEGAETDAEAPVASAAPEPPDCKGQEHHVISRTIAKALEDHRVLRGHYQARDPRLVTRAVDEQAHCGYQSWHRDVDREVVAWLRREIKATPEQFEAFLREIYNRPAMRARFPRGF